MLFLLLAPFAWAADTFVAVGGQFDADSHAIITVVRRQGPWTVGLYTDTVEARADVEGERGRSWAALRAEGFAAGLLISPWEDGAPAPEQALISGYLGADGGTVRYTGRGTWAGVDWRARSFWFLPTQTTTIEVPGWTNIGTVDLVGGWWSKAASIDMRLGLDLRQWLSPHASATARWTPQRRGLRPRVHAQVGWAHRQDRLTLTRLGGLNPYVIPLAGAAWAEFLVEDYAAVQAGPELAAGNIRLGVDGHAAVFEARSAWGLATRMAMTRGAHGIELVGGWAPTLLRQQGEALSVYLMWTFDSRNRPELG